MSGADKTINSEPGKHCRCGPAQRLLRHARVENCDERDNQSHRKRMADSYWRQGFPYGGSPLFLHSKSHGKEPAHAGIDAVKGAEA
jgi:hypothetical protein